MGGGEHRVYLLCLFDQKPDILVTANKVEKREIASMISVLFSRLFIIPFVRLTGSKSHLFIYSLEMKGTGMGKSGITLLH